jgi:hypothetical protein
MKKDPKKNAEALIAHFEQKYKVSRTEVCKAIIRFGLVRSRIDAYFLVQAHEIKKASKDNDS